MGLPEVAYLDRLIELNDAMVWSDHVDEAIVRMLPVVRRLAGADLGPVYLLDTREESLRLVAEPSERALLEHHQTLPASTYARLPLLTQTLRPSVIADLEHHEAEDFLPEDVADKIAGWLTNGAVVPLVADGRLLGVLCLSFRQKEEWTAERITFLATVGRIFGSAIYQAQMAVRVEELAALEERRRLSRELHDGISQDVSALGLRVAAAIEAFTTANVQALPDDLGHIADIALRVQQQLREEMVGLRVGAEEDTEPFAPQLRSSLERFEEQWFIPVRFDCSEADASRVLPARVTRQLLRVVQEALSNTRLHASAGSVTVRLRRHGSRLVVEVADDGSGFDPALVPPSRLGLRIMRERMVQVGGRVEIESASGQGTCVRATVPLGR